MAQELLVCKTGMAWWNVLRGRIFTIGQRIANDMREDNAFGIKDWVRLIAAVAWFVVFLKWPRLTGGVTLLAVGGAMIAFNAVIFWRTVVRKDSAPSVAPIFGGVLAAVGLALLPVEGIWKWAWIPLLLDWGGLSMLVAAWVNNREQKKPRPG